MNVLALDSPLRFGGLVQRIDRHHVRLDPAPIDEPADFDELQRVRVRTDFVLDSADSFAFKNPDIKTGYFHRTGMATRKDVTFVPTPSNTSAEVAMIQTFGQPHDQRHWARRAWMFTISTIATPDPHHLLTLANDMPPPGVPGGARFVFPPRPQPSIHRSGVITAAISTTLVTKGTGLGAN